MKLRMAENSLFAILLRSPWWWSALCALAAFMLVRLFLEPVYAAFATTPFLVICGIVVWRTLTRPGTARVERRLDALRELGWEAFGALVEGAYAREGHAVERWKGEAADFRLERAGKVALVACRRWKAANAGAEPLRALAAAAREAEADESIWIAAGGVSAQARAYAKEAGVTIVEGAALFALLPDR